MLNEVLTVALTNFVGKPLDVVCIMTATLCAPGDVTVEDVEQPSPQKSEQGSQSIITLKLSVSPHCLHI